MSSKLRGPGSAVVLAAAVVLPTATLIGALPGLSAALTGTTGASPTSRQAGQLRFPDPTPGDFWLAVLDALDGHPTGPTGPAAPRQAHAAREVELVPVADAVGVAILVARVAGTRYALAPWVAAGEVEDWADRGRDADAPDGPAPPDAGVASHDHTPVPPTTTAPPAPPAPPTTAAPAIHLDAGAANDLAGRIAAVRERAGVQALARSGDLDATAAAWAREMAASGNLSHSGFTSSGGLAGENVGRGGSIAVLHAMFESSATHYDTMTHPDFTHLGVAAAVDGDGQLWVVELFQG